MSHSTVEDQFDSRGFIAGVFRGVRSFRIDEEGFLTGVVYRQRWEPGVNKAECRRGTFSVPYYANGGVAWEPTQLPEGHGMDVCRHGIYAYYENSNDYHQNGFVSGVIWGWGKEVAVGTRGFRCMRAQIVALCITEVLITHRDRTELVRGNYPDIPFFDSFEEMTEAFPPDMGEEDELAA
jgi:hypothetical protein